MGTILTDEERANLMAFDQYLNAEALRLAEVRWQEQIEADARNAEYERQVSEYWGRIREAAQALLPEALRPYVGAGPVDEEYAPMPEFCWVAIEAPACAPVHLYMNVDGDRITPDERALWLPRVVMPDDPDEDWGQSVRYVFTPYAHYHTFYLLEQIGAVMVDARQLYNAHIQAEMDWAQKLRAAKEEPREERTIIPTPEERLRIALEDLVTDILDNAMNRRGL